MENDPPSNQGNDEWQRQVTELQTQVSQLATQLAETQNQLNQALAGQTSKAELEALKMELSETRTKLETAQAELSETLTQMRDRLPPKSAGDPPAPATNQENQSPRSKRVWV